MRYINTKTYEVLEGIIPKGIDWLEIPEGAVSAYYFDGNDPDGDQEIVFYDSLGEIYDDGWSPTEGYNISYREKWGKLFWERGKDESYADNKINDQINRPKHYTSDDCGVEAIELTSLLPCCISNALKYVWRCGKKDEDLQELKKAEWYLEYSISNNLPSSIEGLSDTLDFEILVNKVKGSWVGGKYMFIDAMYWGNQELMLKAVKGIINGIQTVEK